MQEIVFRSSDNQALTTSAIVAEKFGKEHKHVLEAIRSILNGGNVPYQRYIDCGYFRTIEQKYTVPSGETRINIKTLVYQRGLDYIRKMLKRLGYVEAEGSLF